MQRSGHEEMTRRSRQEINRRRRNAIDRAGGITSAMPEDIRGGRQTPIDEEMTRRYGPRRGK